MATVTQIENLALGMLGAKPITDHDQPDSTAASAMKVLFDDTRDATLRAHNWNFATERFSAPLDGTPDWGFGNQYQLSQDPFVLRVVELNPDRHGLDADFKVEGRHILTDEGDPLEYLGIIRVTNPALFDPLFVDVLAARLAWKGAYRITQSREIERDKKADYKDALREARSVDAQEGTPAAAFRSRFLEARDE